MTEQTKRMIQQAIPVDWMPWDDESIEVNEAYDLLWSHVPPPKDSHAWTVAELQGNLIRAILMGIKWGARHHSAIIRRQTERSEDMKIRSGME